MKKNVSSRAQAHKATNNNKYVLGVFPKNEAQWIALSNDMIAWAHLDTSYALDDFPLSKGYSPHKFYKWTKHSEYFAEALEFTRYMVGSRREKAARERRMDSTIVLKTMPLYNYEFKELVMDKIQKHQESRSYTVVMEPIQDSPLVPPLPKREGVANANNN